MQNRYSKLDRRKFVTGSMAGITTLTLANCSSSVPREIRTNTVQIDPAFGGSRPNIVLINADDLGYGDLGCYGGTAIKTPHIDGLAAAGIRMQQYYACDSVCSPSRAGLLTGRYPVRMGLDVPIQPTDIPFLKGLLVRLAYLSSKVGLMDVASGGAAHGLSENEITIAEALKVAHYRTALVGKWHLGDFTADRAFHPLAHGFDRFFGVPHSNDMTPFPLYENYNMIEENIADQSILTRRYTEEAIRTISEVSDAPYFVYLAHTFPHRPLHASQKFTGTSDAGLYGDAVEEIDWSVGEILRAVRESGQSDNTIILFTSDNGPWYQGSPGVLRGRKGQSYEGGNRVPLVAHWPGLPAELRGQARDAIASNLDLFPTLLHAAGLLPPSDRIIDGRDMTAILESPVATSRHEAIYYYHHGQLEGVRVGKWKYFREINHYVWPMPVNKATGGLSNHTTGPLPLLFNIELDAGEAYNLADHHPEAVTRLESLMQKWEQSIATNRGGWQS